DECEQAGKVQKDDAPRQARKALRRNEMPDPSRGPEKAPQRTARNARCPFGRGLGLARRLRLGVSRFSGCGSIQHCLHYPPATEYVPPKAAGRTLPQSGKKRES